MRIALFDLDETLIAADSASLWLRWLIKQNLASANLLDDEQTLMEQYYRGELSMVDYMKTTLSPLKGVSQQQVASWAAEFIQQEILPRVYPAARERLQWHREQGHYILVISATGEHLVVPIAEQLGADAALAIGVAQQDGYLTGETYGILTYQEGKVQRLAQWLAENPELQFDYSYGYSDSINDQPLLEYVDEATTINPDPRLKLIAEQQGWPMLPWALD